MDLERGGLGEGFGDPTFHIHAFLNHVEFLRGRVGDRLPGHQVSTAVLMRLDGGLIGPDFFCEVDNLLLIHPDEGTEDGESGSGFNGGYV